MSMFWEGFGTGVLIGWILFAAVGWAILIHMTHDEGDR